MKIALAYPRGNEMSSKFDNILDTRPRQTLIPLGMLYIVANSPVKDIYFIDNRVNNFDDLSLFYLLHQYDLVGFGGTIFESEQAVIVSKMLREYGVKTPYGGANATVNYGDYLNDFDYVVTGEADRFNFDLKFKLTHLPRIKDLDNLNYPARHKVNMNDYNRSEKWLSFPTDTIVSSRGCPYDCSFCSSRIIWDRRYTMRSADNVIGEVKHLQKDYGTKSIYFREDNFTVNKRRLYELCVKMPVEWKCESRVDAIDDETARMMSEGGCKVIWFGIEHTDNDILKSISKGITYDQTMTALDACEKYGIKAVGSFIVGLPDESLWTIIKNAIRINGLKLDHVSINRLFMFARSEMYDQVIKENLDVYSHKGIILPKTRNMSKHTVDLAYMIIKKWFAIKEKYLKQCRNS